ncbi:MAG: LysR family transcriptional regulator [Pseudomonadota bacterium]
MNSQLNWDDMRLVRTIIERGSLSGAAREFGVSHRTVFRRLNALEQRLDVRFFDRSRTRYTPTLAGEEVAELATRLESDVRDVERRIAGRDLRPSGTVRITTTDSLLFGWLSSVIVGFRTTHPDIALELVVSNNVLNLSKREADIALRPTARPDPGVVCQKIGTIEQAIYGVEPIVRTITSRDDLERIDWIGPDDSMSYGDYSQWLAQHGHDQQCKYRTNSVYGFFSLAKAGAGLTVLPLYLGEPENSLQRYGDTIAALSTDLWLLSHPDLRTTERIRALVEYLSVEATFDVANYASRSGRNP